VSLLLSNEFMTSSCVVLQVHKKMHVKMTKTLKL